MQTGMPDSKNTGVFVNPWIIALTVMLATFMEVLDTSVANVALPHIAGSLSATVDEATWVLTSYLVSNAIVLPLSGWFSSLIGRKRFYMTCVTLFTVSSMLCGLAPSLTVLIVCRILQGIGGGALQPISQSILVESFPRHKQGMAMAVYGMGVVVAPVIGPTLGGWITDNYSWRWIFLINIPVGALSLTLTSLLIWDPVYFVRKAWKGMKVDYIGLGLLSLGLAALEITLDDGQKNDWFGSNFIVTMAVIALIGLVGVVLWELRQKEPVVDFRMLQNRNFMLSTATMFLLGFVLYASTMLLPVFLQTLLGYSAMRSGMVLSPGGLVIAVTMPLVGFLLSKVEPRWLVIFGLCVSAFGLFGMAGFDLDIDYHTAMMARVVQSAGLAFLFVPINTMAFATVPREKMGSATGLINLARNVGGSSGIAIVTTLLARRTQFHQARLVGNMSPFDPNYVQALAGTAHMLASGGANATQAAAQAQGMFYGMLQRQSAMMAFVDSFYVLGIIFLAVVPLMFFIKKVGPHKGPVVVEYPLVGRASTPAAGLQTPPPQRTGELQPENRTTSINDAVDLRPVLHLRRSSFDLPDRLAARAVHHLRRQRRIRHHRGQRFHARPRAGQLVRRRHFRQPKAADAGDLRRLRALYRHLRRGIPAHLSLGGSLHRGRFLAGYRSLDLRADAATDYFDGGHAPDPGRPPRADLLKCGLVGRHALLRQYPRIGDGLSGCGRFPDAVAGRIRVCGVRRWH